MIYSYPRTAASFFSLVRAVFSETVRTASQEFIELSIGSFGVVFSFVLNFRAHRLEWERDAPFAVALC